MTQHHQDFYEEDQDQQPLRRPWPWIAPAADSGQAQVRLQHRHQQRHIALLSPRALLRLPLIAAAAAGGWQQQLQLVTSARALPAARSSLLGTLQSFADVLPTAVFVRVLARPSAVS
jgi:hypothetical protein